MDGRADRHREVDAFVVAARAQSGVGAGSEAAGDAYIRVDRPRQRQGGAQSEHIGGLGLGAAGVSVGEEGLVGGQAGGAGSAGGSGATNGPAAGGLAQDTGGEGSLGVVCVNGGELVDHTVSQHLLNREPQTG